MMPRLGTIFIFLIDVCVVMSDDVLDKPLVSGLYGILLNFLVLQFALDDRDDERDEQHLRAHRYTFSSSTPLCMPHAPSGVRNARSFFLLCAQYDQGRKLVWGSTTTFNGMPMMNPSETLRAPVRPAPPAIAVHPGRKRAHSSRLKMIGCVPSSISDRERLVNGDDQRRLDVRRASHRKEG